MLFAVTLRDRRLAKADKPPWSLSELAGTFYVRPRQNPGFTWVFASRFLFILAYAFLVTYQAYYLLDRLGSAEDDVARQIFLGTLTQSGVVVAASLVSGRLSDRTGRRKIFVVTAAFVDGMRLFVIAVASDFDGFLVGMAISGLGFGMYVAVDLALVADVLPDSDNVAKDLGVFNIAGALPFAIAPALAPVVLAIGSGSYGVLQPRRRAVAHPAEERIGEERDDGPDAGDKRQAARCAIDPDERIDLQRQRDEQGRDEQQARAHERQGV